MADRYGKGSIIYKFLILVLTAALVASIWYPKKLWDQEDRNTVECRYRMSNLHNAELQYLRFKGVYTDSIEELIEYVKTDTMYRQLVDTTFTVPLVHLINDFDSLKIKQAELDRQILEATGDSLKTEELITVVENYIVETRLLRDRLEFLREMLTTHPCAPVSTFDSALEILARKDFFLQFRVIENMVRLGNSDEALKANDDILTDYENVKSRINDTIANLPQIFRLVDSLYVCPTVRKEYKLTVIDTSAIKFANVECPIDSADIAKVENDFLLSTIGALKIENHGKIDGGEKSWERVGGAK